MTQPPTLDYRFGEKKRKSRLSELGQVVFYIVLTLAAVPFIFCAFGFLLNLPRYIRWYLLMLGA